MGNGFLLLGILGFIGSCFLFHINGWLGGILMLFAIASILIGGVVSGDTTLAIVVLISLVGGGVGSFAGKKDG